MGNFQDTFETRKRSFVSAFSIFMTVPIRYHSCKQIPLQDIIRINIVRKNIVAIRDYICECLRPATLLKKRLWRGCFPVNFAKFLRTPFLTEHLRWLLLLIN